MPPRRLTGRQAEVVRYLLDYMAEFGAPPTQHEIRHRFRWRHVNSVYAHLDALARKGYLEMAGGFARGLRLPGARLALVFDGTPQGRRLRRLWKRR